MAGHRRFVIVEPEIPYDLRSRWVGSANRVPAVQQPARLKKVRGALYVRGNDAVVRARRRNTVNLYREQDGNSVILQLSCQ